MSFLIEKLINPAFHSNDFNSKLTEDSSRFAQKNLKMLLSNFKYDSFVKLTTNQKISVIDDLKELAAKERIRCWQNAILIAICALGVFGFIATLAFSTLTLPFSAICVGSQIALFAMSYLVYLACIVWIYPHRDNIVAIKQLSLSLLSLKINGKTLLEKSRNIFAFGDVHGELEGAKENLQRADLIDSSGNWQKSNRSVCIQMGDVIDRGPDSRGAWGFFKKIQMQAEKEGGKVIRLIGNHELMLLQKFSIKRANYENPLELASEIREEILSCKVQLAYTDGIRLFVHAGVRSWIKGLLDREIKDKKGGILGWKNHFFDQTIRIKDFTAHLNQILVQAAYWNDFSHEIFQVGISRRGPCAVGGVLWEDISEMKKTSSVEEISQVVAHCPPKFFESPIRIFRKKKLICIDAGLCRENGNNHAFIKIHGKKIEIYQKIRNIWNLFLWKRWSSGVA